MLSCCVDAVLERQPSVAKSYRGPFGCYLNITSVDSVQKSAGSAAHGPGQVTLSGRKGTETRQSPLH